MSRSGSLGVMLQVVHETEGFDDEADEVGDGGDQDEGSGTLFHEGDIEDQHEDGEGHLDAFIDIKPSLFGNLCIEVFLHQRAVEGTENHVEVGCHDHPVIPPLVMAEETKQDADDDEVGNQEQGQVICGFVTFQFFWFFIDISC